MAEQPNLVLKGDSSAAKAFVRYLPLCLFLGVGGVVISAVGMSAMDASYSGTSRSFERYICRSGPDS